MTASISLSVTSGCLQVYSGASQKFSKSTGIPLPAPPPPLPTPPPVLFAILPSRSPLELVLEPKLEPELELVLVPVPMLLSFSASFPPVSPLLPSFVLCPFGCEDGLSGPPEDDWSLARKDWNESTMSLGAWGWGAGAWGAGRALASPSGVWRKRIH